MLEALTVEDFAPAVGSSFLLAREDGPPVSLVLTEATPAGPATDGARAQFALLFEGPDEPALDQAMHALRHPDLGELPLFLVPVGLRDGRRLYEAVFA